MALQNNTARIWEGFLFVFFFLGWQMFLEESEPCQKCNVGTVAWNFGCKRQGKLKHPPLFGRVWEFGGSRRGEKSCDALLALRSTIHFWTSAIKPVGNVDVSNASSPTAAYVDQQSVPIRCRRNRFKPERSNKGHQYLSKTTSFQNPTNGTTKQLTSANKGDLPTVAVFFPFARAPQNYPGKRPQTM